MQNFRIFSEVGEVCLIATTNGERVLHGCRKVQDAADLKIMKDFDYLQYLRLSLHYDLVSFTMLNLNENMYHFA